MNKTKARSEHIRKRAKIEEKYSWDRMSDADDERQSHSTRAVIASIVVLTIFTLYLFKLYEVQVSSHEYYATKSDSNRIRIRPIPAQRGNIFDRHGKILAKNITTFDLIVKKEKINNYEEFLSKVKIIIELSDSQVKNLNKQFRNKRIRDITLLEDITMEEYSKISVDKHALPEIELGVRSRREYLYPYSTSHVLGYTGNVSDSDVYSGVIDIQEGMTEVGKLGVERFYQNILAGESGFEKLETDALGEIIRTVETKDSKRGDDVYLTIDINLQNYAYEQIKNKEGSIIVMNPNNGDILSFISAPGYDLNLFTKSITTENYNKLINDIRKPLINRAINGQYPPGSTLKPFVGLIALEENIINEKKLINCSGAYSLKNHKRPFKCWKKEGHGPSDLSYSLTQSCDVFFYRVAELTGIDTISENFYKYGLCMITIFNSSYCKKLLFLFKNQKLIISLMIFMIS